MTKTMGNLWIKCWELPAGFHATYSYPLILCAHTIKGKWINKVLNLQFTEIKNNL